MGVMFEKVAQKSLCICTGTGTVLVVYLHLDGRKTKNYSNLFGPIGVWRCTVGLLPSLTRPGLVSGILNVLSYHLSSLEELKRYLKQCWYKGEGGIYSQIML